MDYKSLFARKIDIDSSYINGNGIRCRVIFAVFRFDPKHIKLRASLTTSFSHQNFSDIYFISTYKTIN